MEYKPADIEKKWQHYWAKNKTFAAHDFSEKPKYYALDMFPYPSGTGLHVGHPLGYIASDIYSRYKRGCGFNVLHPMGYDSFGLPAEQYAIQTGQHPAITTRTNIEGGKDKRSSLDSIQQVVFASILANKKPAVAIYDTDGMWGKYEHRVWAAAKDLGVKFIWFSDGEIRDVE